MQTSFIVLDSCAEHIQVIRIKYVSEIEILLRDLFAIIETRNQVQNQGFQEVSQ